MTDIKHRLKSLSAEKRTMLAGLIADKKEATFELEEEHPVVQSNQKERFEPFALTGLQQAFLLGRTDAFSLGGLPSCAYLELECDDLDVSRLGVAWQRLIDRHEMLRSVVLDNGTQRILEKPPSFEVAQLDLRKLEPEAVEGRLEELRESMLHYVRPASVLPLCELRITLLPDGKYRLHFRLYMLVVDAAFIWTLIYELHELLDYPQAVLPKIYLSYRDYFLHLQ